ncbi:MAG: chemotaxis protein CheD [Candidatus Riflebacteria bacterium]|nr:chemotaxis protein CheD [Candidatus Riflebacteria bacterium]
MPEIYPVGMADIRIAKAPDVLAVYGVGSCVIVAMYDPKSTIGGLAHVILPDSTGIASERLNPKKFADTAVPLLYQTLSHAGVFKGSLWAKVVGGAEMFPPTEDFSLNIGKKNTEAVIDALKKLGVPVMAADTGGTAGRSMEMRLDSGRISLTVLGESARDL